jgi:hypothetical protein
MDTVKCIYCNFRIGLLWYATALLGPKINNRVWTPFKVAEYDKTKPRPEGSMVRQKYIRTNRLRACIVGRTPYQDSCSKQR